MGIKDLLTREKDPEHLEREIQEIITEGEEKGIIDPSSGRMIRNILEFRSTVVREIMIPRTEIVSIQQDASIQEILDLIVEHSYTRMPVYSGTIDNIIGILNVKDLFRMWSTDVTQSDTAAILRKPYYIPETKNVNLLLHEFKYGRHHMAIVIDEYGGTSGLVTIEDLIEEIVGEIPDEYDTAKKEIVEMPGGWYQADGRTEIETIAEYFGLEMPEGKFETLGGFILHLIRKIPASGEKVYYGNFEMIIESADERTIKKVRLRRIDDKGKGMEADNPKSER
jgi:CBS domain containing-hemolysin-like protein